MYIYIVICIAMQSRRLAKHDCVEWLTHSKFVEPYEEITLNLLGELKLIRNQPVLVSSNDF